eukprot:11176222-Lingulodinium_polyedra.AAC.1
MTPTRSRPAPAPASLNRARARRPSAAMPREAVTPPPCSEASDAATSGVRAARTSYWSSGRRPRQSA